MLSDFIFIMRNMNYPGLAPEFEKALKMATKRIEPLITSSFKAQKMCSDLWMKSGTVIIIHKKPKIRDIPSGEGWRWNQAKRKHIVMSESFNMPLEIMKLVPRKAFKGSSQSLPKVKLWQVCLLNAINPITVFWCERGIDECENMCISTTFEKEDNTTLDISDFSFLAPFMNPNDGRELWPDLPMYKSMDNNVNSTSLSQPADWDELVYLLLTP